MGRRRNCITCIAYCNMLDRREYVCGLGFPVKEHATTRNGQWRIEVSPVDNKCSCVPKPKTKIEFIKIAKELGIEWDPDEVMDVNDIF